MRFSNKSAEPLVVQITGLVMKRAPSSSSSSSYSYLPKPGRSLQSKPISNSSSSNACYLFFRCLLDFLNGLLISGETFFLFPLKNLSLANAVRSGRPRSSDFSSSVISIESGIPNEPEKSPFGLSVIPTAVNLHSVGSSFAQLAVPRRFSLNLMFVLTDLFDLISMVPLEVK